MVYRSDCRYLTYSIYFSEFMPIVFTRKRTKHENTRSPPFWYHTKMVADGYKARKALILRELLEGRSIMGRVQWNTTPCEPSFGLRRRGSKTYNVSMYQSMLADVSSVSPSSEQRHVSQHTLYGVQHIHINVLWAGFYILGEAPRNV